MATIQQLDYAPTPKRRWHDRSFRKRLITWTVVIAAAATLYRWYTPVSKALDGQYCRWRASRLYARCMAHEGQRDQAVWDTKGSKQSTQPRFFGNGCEFWPLCEAWWGGYRSSAPVSANGATIFLHGRSASDGTRLLVAGSAQLLQSHEPDGTRGWSFMFYFDALPQVPKGSPSSVTFGLADSHFSRIEILSGYPDSVDSAHFVIPYRVDGQTEYIDGWLLPKGVLWVKPRTGW